MLTSTLIANGIPRSTIARKRRTGFLTTVCRGVHIVGTRSLNREQSLLVAALSAGDDAALAGVAGLEIHAFSRFTAWFPLRVLAPTARRSQFENVMVERSIGLTDGHVAADLPVMTIPWLVNDLGRELTSYQLANVVHDSQFKRVASLAEILDVHARYDRVAGHAVVAEALRLYESGSAGTRSELEDRFLRLVIAAGVPLPLVNTVVDLMFAAHELDCWWSGDGWNVELDGGQHGRRNTTAKDRAQDAAVLASGGRVQRFGWFDVVEEPERVIDWLRANIRL